MTLSMIPQNRRSSAGSAARFERSASGSRKITAPGRYAMAIRDAIVISIVRKRSSEWPGYPNIATTSTSPSANRQPIEFEDEIGAMAGVETQRDMTDRRPRRIRREGNDEIFVAVTS